MKTFTLKPEHIKLLQAMYFDYRDDYEIGAPGADQKRPYGNSNVAGDVAEILGYPYDEEDDSDLMRWHSETGTALQVIMSTGSFKPGKYVNVAGTYDRPKWRKK